MLSKPYLYRCFGIVLFLILLTGIYAQTPTTCAVSAAPYMTHSEGLAERMGDIIIKCTGSPGVTVNDASVNVSLPVTITNRINAAGFATDASLSIDTGTGNVPSGVAGRVTNQNISFDGFAFTIPASGIVSIVIDDLRANVNQLGLLNQAPIMAFLGGSLALTNNAVSVAVTQQGLLATSLDSVVTCTGSPTPSTISVTNLIGAHTAEQTTRITEGFPSAFQPKDPTSDTGTRFLLSYGNMPAGATVYLPDAIAGSGAAVPTSGGDLGTSAAVGQYLPGSQTLLLVRVLNADATGAGGTLAQLPSPNSSGVLVLDGASAVSMTNGAGYAVYEVVDANASSTESAQIPNFFAIPAHSAASSSTGSISLAPTSTLGTASTTAPIPRFVAVTPPSDCTAEGDCSASYYPKLQVTTTDLEGTAVSGAFRKAIGNIYIKNVGGGVLDWTASATYTNGSGWILFTQPFGTDNTIIQVFGDPSQLAPGTYQATVIIDGGPVAGSQSFPLTFTVTAPQVTTPAPDPAPSTPPVTTPAPSVVVTGITNAADFHAGPVAPGQLASVWGSHMAGQNIAVTFNGTKANLLYTGDKQINLQVPASLAGQSSAKMVVTADTVSSDPLTVQLTAVAPAIFTPGVLNQDSSVNSAANPAQLGSVLQIFLTGMPDSGAVASVTIQNRGSLVPQYAGAAPGLVGLQQVNVAVPSDLAGVPSTLTICVTGAAKQQYCSQPESIALKP